jgi:DNA-nicking Smr family endonuclease
MDSHHRNPDRARREILRYIEEHGVVDKDASRRGAAPRKQAQSRNRNAPRRTLDLHGKTQRQAIGLLHQALRRCRAHGVRELLVIHGRGVHSAMDGPVLKQAVRDALDRRFASLVRSWRPGAPREGGAGVTLITLA